MNSSANVLPSTSSTTTTNDKMSGQLIIKAQLGDDIRKMMIHNEDLTLNELVLMMERIFAGKISNADELTIKYLDDDGDKITLLNDSDLTVALHFHKVLRLFVLVNGSEQIPDNSSASSHREGSLIDAKTFRTELQQIRNSVQIILDRLQLPTNQNATNNEATTTTTTSSTFVASTAREFDPYKYLNQNHRSTTPDSTQSKSSTSNTLANNEQKPFQPTSFVPAVDSQHSSSESTNASKQFPTSFQQTPTTASYFVPTGYNNQQMKTGSSPFGGPQPTSFPNMPPLPNSGISRFPTAFTSNSAPPPPPASNTIQTSAFIGQQQQTPLAPPPQQVGFYGQQQALMQQRPGPSIFSPNTTMNNAFAQQQPQVMPSPPSSSSSPATINPSLVQPTSMPTQPPLAFQKPYGGPPPPNNVYNPVQQYPQAS